MVSPCLTTRLTLLFSLSGLLTVPQQAEQTPTRGPLPLSSFDCSALLELCHCPSLQGFSKHLLAEAFPSHGLKWHIQILPTPPLTLLFIVFFSL